MSLQTIKIDSANLTPEQLAKFGDKPATKNKSAFVAGQRLTLKELGWRQLLEEDGVTPVLDNDSDEIFFPVLETSAGDKASIALGLFEVKWDDRLQKPVTPAGPLADYFRKHCTEFTRREMISHMAEEFKDVEFEVTLFFYSVPKKDGGFFRASFPVFLKAE